MGWIRDLDPEKTYPGSIVKKHRIPDPDLQHWGNKYREEEMSYSKEIIVRIVRYHCGGWSEEVNSCILILSYMVYL